MLFELWNRVINEVRDTPDFRFSPSSSDRLQAPKQKKKLIVPKIKPQTFQIFRTQPKYATGIYGLFDPRTDRSMNP